MISALPCPSCGCAQCDICDQEEGSVTLTATVSVSGIGDGDGSCVPCSDPSVNCSPINDTFIIDLTLDTDPEDDADANCYFKFNEILMVDPCGGFSTNVTMNVTISEPDGSGNSVITVNLVEHTFTATATYTVATPFDCSAFGPVSMTITNVTTIHAHCCDATGIAISISLSTS